MSARKHRTVFSVFCVSSLLMFTACLSFATARAEEQASQKVSLADGKLLMMVPANWEAMPKKSGMLDYEFRAPKEAKDDAARITIMRASGGIQANIDRWIGQFDGATKNDAKVEKKEVAGTTVHIVDISGTFKETMGGPFAPGPTTKRENYRMLSAIIETKESGTIFIKITGMQPIVEQIADGFKKSLGELKLP